MTTTSAALTTARAERAAAEAAYTALFAQINTFGSMEEVPSDLLDTFRAAGNAADAACRKASDAARACLAESYHAL